LKELPTECKYVEIGNVKPGNTVKAGDMKFEVLDTHYPIDDTSVLCLSKDILFNKPFDEEGCNNWTESSLRKYLNGEYLYGLNSELINALLSFDRNLIADDGTKDYGECVDTISLISCDEYRKYREYISNKSNWWWTLTPYSTTASRSNVVRHVHSDGSLDNSHTYFGGNGVVPVFLIDPFFKVKVVEESEE
jgi:hypothetical protein